MRRAALLALIPAVFLLASCGGRTTGATNITSSSATLNASASCDANQSWIYYFKYSKDGGATFAKTPDQSYYCSTAQSGTRSANISGLTASTSYVYLVCGRVNGGGENCGDADGWQSGGDPPYEYMSFKTLASVEPRLGIYPAGPYLPDFEAWLGRQVQDALVYLDSRQWSYIDNPAWWVDQQPTDVRLVISVPWATGIGSSMASCAAGSYDSHWRSAAQTFVNHGRANAVIRPLWEWAGSWFEWSVGKTTPANFINCFRHIVSAMRGVSGQQFTFEWNAGNGRANAPYNLETYYPGDAYVNIVGGDLYDEDWGTPNSTFDQRWSLHVNRENGLQWQVNFAGAHGKAKAISEWGLSNRKNSSGQLIGGGDEPRFIQAMHDWMLAHGYAYQIYFNSDWSALNLYPNSKARYKAIYGG